MTHWKLQLLNKQTQQQPLGVRNEDNVEVPKTLVVTSGHLTLALKAGLSPQNSM